MDYIMYRNIRSYKLKKASYTLLHTLPEPRRTEALHMSATKKEPYTMQIVDVIRTIKAAL
jgi:hypothetical protein